MISEEQRIIMYRGLATKGRLVVDEAERAKIDAALETTPDDYYLWCARAVVAETAADAIAAYSTALALRPLSSHTLYNRGRRYMGLNQFDEGLADLRAATLLDPDEGWKWHFQGVAEYFINRFDMAVRSFRKAIEVNLRNGEHLIPFEVEWLWNCYNKLGDHSSAEECLNLVDEQTPVVETEATYKKRILLYRRLMTPADYLASIDFADHAEAGNQLFGLSNFYFYVENDVAASVKYLEQVVHMGAAGSGWGYKMALRELALRKS